MRIPLLLQQQDNIDIIKQKLAEAPDEQYGIGIFIGNMLPFVVLVILAYLMYSYMKNKSNGDENLLDD
ncbi:MULTISPECIES: hypothetical protein [Capnocytophaga]|uniref:hypothetical protein n=1 Tax=Capnocytophaga TaxID=1016 RepID=UPI000BB199A0|nr:MULTISPECIES: hypothetical protein [Capnocytophaga]ATA72301.1 hypothetical protein CGC49_02650 [Capnocytophaga sp. H4358]